MYCGQTGLDQKRHLLGLGFMSLVKARISVNPSPLPKGPLYIRELILKFDHLRRFLHFQTPKIQ